MALSKDDIINAVADMSVMEVVELIEAMEEKFGVSAAAAVMAGPAAAKQLLKSRLNLIWYWLLLVTRKLTSSKLFVKSPVLA